MIIRLNYDLEHKKITADITGITLKNCPCCGGAAQARCINSFYGLPAMRVYCTVCRLETAAEVFSCGLYRRTPAGNLEHSRITAEQALETAVTNWNTRAPAAAINE